MADEALMRQLVQRGYQLYCDVYDQISAQYRLEHEEFDLESYLSMPVDRLRTMAEQGDAAGQYAYGVHLMYRCQDIASGIKWFQFAANNGSVDAMQMLGELYLEDQSENLPDDLPGLPPQTRNNETAMQWLLKAAKAGCSYEIAEDLICLFDNPEEKYPWCLTALAFLQKNEDIIEEIIHIITVLQYAISIRLVVAFQKGQYIDCQKTEDYALMALYWMQSLRELGVESGELRRRGVKPEDVLGWIGECASALQKPYAKAVLKGATEQGCGFAAVLLVPEVLNQAMELRAPSNAPTYFWMTEDFIMPLSPVGPKQFKAANACVEDYFPLVKMAAEDDNFSYRQAETLYRLSHFYVLGLCCRRDASKAHVCLEKAAQMGHIGAQHLLERFHRKFPFGWEFR